MTLRHVQPDYRECSDWLAGWWTDELILITESRCPYEVDPSRFPFAMDGYCQAPTGPLEIWCDEHARQLADWYPNQYRLCVPDQDTPCTSCGEYACVCEVRAVVEALDAPPTCLGSGEQARTHGWQPCPVCGVVVEVHATSWGDLVIGIHPEDPSCG